MFNVKTPIAIATVLLTAANCLAETTNAVPTASERRAAWLKKVGGFCEGETKGKYFLYLNCADIDEGVFSNVIDQMKQVCGIALRHSNEEIVGDPLSYARSVLQTRKDVGAVALFYKGPADIPIETVYPMDKISIINVTPIIGSSKEVFSARATALACRSVAYTAGGAMPFGVEGCMKNVFTPKDIDSLKSKLLHPMSGQLVKSSASDFGFALWKRGTYLAACQGGWAHEPTNELQRTIWNDIRKLPEKPLTIEFDPLKGR
ncbi:MAG: hypothetical protein E7049_04875 [Lentisphaerae bacterium]|nr:hypothetical protein [Lentisphaerota bacterium]